MSNQQLLLTLMLLQIMQRLRQPRPATVVAPAAPAAPAVPAAPAAGRAPSKGSLLPPMRAVQALASRGRFPLAPHSEPCPVYLLCEAEGVHVGRVRVNPSGRDAIHIEDLSVREPFRGQGAGAQLLGAALQLGQRWGRNRAWLVADDKGSGRLLAWYQRLGFQLAGRGPQGRPVLEAHAVRALPVIRRQRDTLAGGQPSYTLRAVPASHAARIHS